jgi:hypothetical protein
MRLLLALEKVAVPEKMAGTVRNPRTGRLGFA